MMKEVGRYGKIKNFKCDLYSDEFGDFIFSRITFTVWDYPVESEILKEE